MLKRNYLRPEILTEDPLLTSNPSSWVIIDPFSSPATFPGDPLEISYAKFTMLKDIYHCCLI